jgi:endoglucanase
MPKIDPNFLHVKGVNITNSREEIVLLRGFCLGGWMNMENFIIGYPGHETGFRKAIEHILGKEKAVFFFDRFLDYFIQWEDLKFIKDLGCNLIRIPLNYHHFEDDDHPFEYKEQGFTRLDQVIGWARSLQLYVILDLHAVQGCQNRGWHCDNSGGDPRFWGQKLFEDRAVALWEEFARRYRGEAYVAGYNVMNEPDADEVDWLNHFYRRVTESIRAIDTNHIIFLEGNHYSQQFDKLDPPFDTNTVYSSHNYVEPMDGMYPGLFKGEAFDRERIERDYRNRASFILRNKVPNWVGEFGCIYENPAITESNQRVMNDMIDIIEAHGHHWSIWTYKDIGLMGSVLVNPESDWMQRTQPIRSIKTNLRCDSWIERSPVPIDTFIHQIAEYSAKLLPLSNDNDLIWKLQQGIQDGILTQVLVPAFSEVFRGLNETEIDHIMQSFAFKNCLPRQELVNLLRRKLYNRDHHIERKG